jgi:uncharacterized membrane protein
MRIRNYFYLTAGILAVLFAATHAWNGHTAVLPELDGGAVALATETVFTYVWHIITAENLIFGIAFLMMAFIREPAKHRFAARMIAVILAVRLAVILGITAALDAASLAASAVDAVAIVVYIALILFGARVKSRAAAA